MDIRSTRDVEPLYLTSEPYEGMWSTWIKVGYMSLSRVYTSDSMEDSHKEEYRYREGLS